VPMMRDKELNWAAFPLSGVFETTDGAIVMVGAFKVNPLQDICNALEIDDLSKENRFSTHDLQVEARPELQAVFRKNFAKNTTAHWIERLDGVDILCAPVKTLEEALADPQTAVNKMIIEATSSTGSLLKLIGSPIDMSDAPFAMHRPPPRLGEHREEILAELGKTLDAA
jgi:crotonobetainyl-CoA:carnitine CoA-transferase CaiB-like acyl-CoA transferase